MPGYEDLTAGELMTITWLIFLSVNIFVFGHIISTYFNYKASKNIKFHMRKEVAKSIAKEIQKPSLIKSIKLWWSERKAKKELENPYKSPFKD